MAYERIKRPKGAVYHYTKRGNLDGIRKDGRLRRFGDRECWVCSCLEDTLRLMELTVMQEGKPYWVIWRQAMPVDAPQELLNLAEEFSFLKKGFRGDLRFYGEPEVFEVADFLEMRTSGPELRME